MGVASFPGVTGPSLLTKVATTEGCGVYKSVGSIVGVGIGKACGLIEVGGVVGTPFTI